MKKFLVILWIVGVFAILGSAEEEAEEEAEEAEDEGGAEETPDFEVVEEEQEGDSCPFLCEPDAKIDDECCENKTCRGFEGEGGDKYCVTEEYYEAMVNFREATKSE